MVQNAHGEQTHKTDVPGNIYPSSSVNDKYLCLSNGGPADSTVTKTVYKTLPKDGVGDEVVGDGGLSAGGGGGLEVIG